MQRGHAFHNQFGELWFSAAHDTSGCRQPVKGRCVWLRERERGREREREGRERSLRLLTPRSLCAQMEREAAEDNTDRQVQSHFHAQKYHSGKYTSLISISVAVHALFSLCKSLAGLQTFAALFKITSTSAVLSACHTCFVNVSRPVRGVEWRCWTEFYCYHSRSWGSHAVLCAFVFYNDLVFIRIGSHIFICIGRTGYLIYVLIFSIVFPLQNVV